MKIIFFVVATLFASVSPTTTAPTPNPTPSPTTTATCTLAATFADGERKSGSLSTGRTTFTWMPGNHVWSRTTPSDSCLGGWTDTVGDAVVVSPTAITCSAGSECPWVGYPAVVADREDGFCVDANGADVNHGVHPHPGNGLDPELSEAECLAWCLSQEGSLGCERNDVYRDCFWFSSVEGQPDIDHGNQAENYWCWVFNPTPSPTTTAPTPPPPPPAPPGWIIDTGHDGTFCCDQAPCVGGQSEFLFQGDGDMSTCVDKCLADAKCKYITVANDAYCMNAQFCNTTNPYKGAPSDTVHTYIRPPSPTPSPTCILKNDDPSSSEVNDAMQAFCPDYATDVGVKGKPEYGGSAKMCKQKDNKYETRLHQAMFHGMFGGASGSGRACKAWCLYDLEEQNRHFRWDNKKVCWKTRKAKARACKDSTNEERGFAADIFDSFCAV